MNHGVTQLIVNTKRDIAHGLIINKLEGNCSHIAYVNNFTLGVCHQAFRIRRAHPPVNN
jgi:hypothetical protein